MYRPRRGVVGGKRPDRVPPIGIERREGRRREVAWRGLKRSEERTTGDGRSALRAVPRRSVAGGVRSICPFCGNSEQTGGEPCCEEWQQTTSVEVDVAAERRLGLTAALP